MIFVGIDVAKDKYDCYSFSSDGKVLIENLTRLTNILTKYSRGKYDKDNATQLRELARNSIGTSSDALGFELQQIIRTIVFLQEHIASLDKKLLNTLILLIIPIT